MLDNGSEYLGMRSFDQKQEDVWRGLLLALIRLKQDGAIFSPLSYETCHVCIRRCHLTPTFKHRLESN